jgi:hypothetical protein
VTACVTMMPPIGQVRSGAWDLWPGLEVGAFPRWCRAAGACRKAAIPTLVKLAFCGGNRNGADRTFIASSVSARPFSFSSAVGRKARAGYT